MHNFDLLVPVFLSLFYSKKITGQIKWVRCCKKYRSFSFPQSLFSCLFKEHVKEKLAFLAGHSAKALTPLPLAVSGIRDFMQTFLYKYMDICTYVFETSKLRHGKWHYKIKMSPEKHHVQWKLENWKRHFMICTYDIWYMIYVPMILWLPN